MLINGYSVISTQCFSELTSHLSIFKAFWSSLNGSFCVSPGCHIMVMLGFLMNTRGFWAIDTSQQILLRFKYLDLTVTFQEEV